MSERTQSPDDRELLSRSALTEQFEAWDCISAFTEAGFLYAAKVILERDIDYEGRETQALYNRRSQEKKQQ